MNTETQNETTQHSELGTQNGTPPLAAPPGRPLTRLSVLSERQLEHVHAWIKEGVPSRKISEFCRKNFDKEIPHMTFVRYANRFEPFRHLHGLNDSKEAAKEISQYAATGNPSFSVNTLELLEQQAFDLALAHNRDADAADLHILEKLWALIHKAKNTQIRERHAAVQEQKLALRREELELKRQLAATRLNPNLHSASPAQNGWSEAAAEPSRDAATQTNAAKADQTPSPKTNPVNLVNPVQNPSSSSSSSSSSASSASTPSPEIHNSKLLIPNSFRCVSPNPLPPEVVEENILYARKLDCGEIKIISIPGELYQTEYWNPADKHYFETTISSHKATFVPENRDFYLRGLKSSASQCQPDESDSSNPIDHPSKSLETTTTNPQPNLQL